MGKRRTGLAIAVVVLASALASSACNLGSITQPSDIVFPASGVSFGRQVQPLFDMSCSYSGCHNSVDRAGAVSLASYYDMLTVPGLIRPGDSSGSVLFQIVSQRLPHNSASIPHLITPSQAHGIAVWIEEGALNN